MSSGAGRVALVVVFLAAAPAARAWDPATTQAGLTERAVLASVFHEVMRNRLARTLGAMEPLTLHSQLLAPGERQLLWSRISALDPAEGYRPSADGVASAMSWVTAGAVLAETPPERARHHFFDPRTGLGLDDGSGLRGKAHAMRLALGDGASLRGLATGVAFDMTGVAAPKWVTRPDNDQSLAVFHQRLHQAITAADANQREASMALAWMAMGGIVAALEDMGSPAHTRNDFRGAFLDKQGPSGWDRGSDFERFVAARYGRVGVPAAGEVIERADLQSFFSAPDGEGLAQRTQRRFFSEGTVPQTVSVDASTTPRDVLRAARASLPYPLPTVKGLELRKATRRRYMMEDGRRTLAYQRFPDRVVFALDEAVFADSAAVLLPEVAGYAAGLINHLLRGALSFSFSDGRVAVSLEGVRGSLSGTLEILAEDREGRRRVLPVEASGPFAGGELAVVDVPAGTRRVAAIVRGRDGAGPVVVVGEAVVP